MDIITSTYHYQEMMGWISIEYQCQLNTSFNINNLSFQHLLLSLKRISIHGTIRMISCLNSLKSKGVTLDQPSISLTFTYHFILSYHHNYFHEAIVFLLASFSPLHQL
jgi:hypothetical protein